MATRNQSDAIRQELNGTWQQISGAFNFSYTSIAGFPRLLLHHGGWLRVLAASGSILWLKPEYQVDGGTWADSGSGPDGLKLTFPDGKDGLVPLQCNRPCFPTAYPAGTVINTRVMAKCSGSVVLCDSLLVPQAEAVKTWMQSDSYQWNEAEDDPAGLAILKIGSPAGTGAAWTASNTNVQLVPLSGNRFAWHSRNSDVGRTKTDTVVGQVDSAGGFSFGAISVQDNHASSSLSSNTYCVVPIGNGKFARYRTNPTSFDIYDCGSSGLVPSLAATAQGSVSTLSYGCKDSLMCDESHLALLPDYLGSFPGYYNVLYIYSINNVSNAVGAEFVTNSIWSDTGRVLYGTPAPFAGCSASGGFLVSGATAVNGASVEMSISYVNKTSGSASKFTCADATGKPIAIHCQPDGKFAIAYIIPTGAVRVRCGVLAGSSITFGGYFDYADGSILMTDSFHEASIKSDNAGEFVLCLQDRTSNTTQCIAFSTDGSTVSCADTTGISYTKGSVVMTLISTGFAGKYVFGNYGASGSTDFPDASERYTSMIEVADL
jgi:hypothetical protein